MKQTVFSGIQPTGNIHIGNYLGAIQHWVNSQVKYNNIFCVVDLHAITIPQDPSTLKTKSRELAGLLLASGIDPEKSELFIQSHVSEHCELAWILNCITPMGWMQRMTQFKEKSQNQRENVSVGLFAYPALMAADILIYQTDLVPVGEDQKQHVELTRDVAQKFNSTYGETFKLPEPVIAEVGARIMGLDDPMKKMSKSDTSQGHAVLLLDSPDEILNKVKRATTDSQREIIFDENRPGIYNLLVIYELFTQKSRNEIEAMFDGKGYAIFKKDLAEVIIEGIKPVQLRYKELTADPSYIDSLLAKSAERLRPTAQKTLKLAKERMGIG